MNIIIFGMHRSGTSMVTGLLEQLGFFVGHKYDLLQRGNENPKGFFERRDFRIINDELLSENNFDWYKVADFSIEALNKKSRKRYQSSATEIFKQLNSQGDWVIKEPRFCLLFPLLQPLCFNTIKLIVYRDPLETAVSLCKRNLIPFPFGLALWEKYYSHLLNSISHNDTVLMIDYNKLLTNPEKEVATLVSRISLLSGVIFAENKVKKAHSFIDPKLNRSKDEIILTPDIMTENQKLLFEELGKNIRGRTSTNKYKCTSYSTLKQNQKVFDHINDLKNNNKELTKELGDIKKSLSWQLMKPFRELALKYPKLAIIVENYVLSSVRRIKQLVMFSRVKLGLFNWSNVPDIENRVATYQNESYGLKNKIAVYTAIYGGYDFLTVPDFLDSDIDYVCFTDQPMNTFGVWQTRPSPYYHPDPTRVARYVKTHPHELLSDYEIVIWIDSNIVIRGDIRKYINKVIKHNYDMGFIKHPLRDCLYDEAEVCKNRNKENHAEINRQVERYRKLNHTAHSGLFETNFFISSHKNQKVISFFRIWWHEIALYSKRDQLSVVWALNQSEVTHGYIMPENVSVRNNCDFSIYSHAESRMFSAPKQLKKFRSISQPQSGNMFSKVKNEKIAHVHNKSIDIIICVHNALEDTKLCLSSVLEHLSENHKIIIINDASDEDTTKYLQSFSHNNVSVLLIENQVNIGYVRSANSGLKHAKGDFKILLNSDTIVSENWADKMAIVAYSSDVIGIVGPLSNAASWQSIPNIRGKRGQTAINKLPENLTVADLDRKCEQWAFSDIYPRVPLVHGFCIGIKQEVINNIGYFDDINFERYYGEENDYCFRAGKEGFELAVATNTFVYHKKSQSIKEEERLIYMKQAGKRFREIHGSDKVTLACKQMAKHPLLIHMRNEAAKYLKSVG